MAKTKMSIYLLRDALLKEQDILDVAKPDQVIPISEKCTLYLRTSDPYTPQWVNSFFDDETADTISTQAHASSVSALLVSTVTDEEGISPIAKFALSFGRGYTMLKRDAYIGRFGLKTALNIAEEDSLRKISRTTVAGSARRASEQVPNNSPISSFEMDLERDLLEGVTIFDKSGKFGGGSVEGSDRLSYSLDIEFAGINDHLREVYSTYTKDSYKERFGWVDRIASVKDSKTVESLEEIAISIISCQTEEIWMAVPEVLEWSEIAGFKIPGISDLQDDIRIADVVSGSRNPISSFEQLRNKPITAISATDGSVYKKWSAANCLYGELQYDGRQYCINNGRWYRVDKNFVDEINGSYLDTAISPIILPPASPGEHEGDYNARVSKDNPLQFALMDKRNVSVGGGRNRVEVCDILTNDGAFIHIKNYSGSSALSHLFSQGLVSTRLLKADPEFREGAQTKLSEANKDFPFDITSQQVSEVVFAIISDENCRLPNIPFFSKVTFSNVKSTLELMDVKVSMRTIPRLDTSAQSGATA